jgi:hypothetical protein
VLTDRYTSREIEDSAEHRERIDASECGCPCPGRVQDSSYIRSIELTHLLLERYGGCVGADPTGPSLLHNSKLAESTEG